MVNFRKHLINFLVLLPTNFFVGWRRGEWKRGRESVVARILTFSSLLAFFAKKWKTFCQLKLEIYASVYSCFEKQLDAGRVSIISALPGLLIMLQFYSLHPWLITCLELQIQLCVDYQQINHRSLFDVFASGMFGYVISYSVSNFLDDFRMHPTLLIRHIVLLYLPVDVRDPRVSLSKTCHVWNSPLTRHYWFWIQWTLLITNIPA